MLFSKKAAKSSKEVTSGGQEVTFAVDPVKPETKPLPEIRAHELLRIALGADVESCSDYHSTVCADITGNALLGAVVTAFAKHRPLVLSPDAVWITIAQGVAHHMAIHGERLRSRFVSHQGKLELTYTVRDWIDGSPENPWPAAFANWSGQIRAHVGDAVHDALACDFSTTTPVERAAGDVVMMDVFQRYFQYRVLCICGIPSVTLEGTPADWQRLRDKAAALAIFDMDWWLAHLLPICDQFVRAARGDVDLGHWQDVCQLRDEYGGAVITGWVTKLFPYIRSYYDGPPRRRNPVFDTGQGFSAHYAPSGLSRVPFTWENVVTGRTRPMEAIGGLLGVSQDPASLALRPKVGWAVREAEPLDAVIRRVQREHVTFAPAPSSDDEESMGSFARARAAPPADVGEFYSRTNGAELFGAGDNAACRIVPRAEFAAVDDDHAAWRRVAWLRDGSCLALNSRPRFTDDDDDEQRRLQRWDGTFAPICHVPPEGFARSRPHAVIALSFTEFLQRFLDAGGKPYWLSDAALAKKYGDADRYMRENAR